MAAPKMTPPPAAPPEAPAPTQEDPSQYKDQQKAMMVPGSPPLPPREAFELRKDKAKALAASTIVPEAYKGNPANCYIIVEMAERLGVSELMLMNNIDVIRGRPAWRSQFIIAVVNTCGKFKGSLKFAVSGEGMNRSCYAYAIDKLSGETVTGETVTMQMAKAEGWLDRDGSKWKTMPELMLRYRAGAFFGRLYVPERLLGLLSVEEVHDIIDVTPDVVAPTGVAAAKEMLGKG